MSKDMPILKLWYYARQNQSDYWFREIATLYVKWCMYKLYKVISNCCMSFHRIWAIIHPKWKMYSTRWSRWNIFFYLTPKVIIKILWYSQSWPYEVSFKINQLVWPFRSYSIENMSRYIHIVIIFLLNYKRLLYHPSLKSFLILHICI